MEWRVGCSQGVHPQGLRLQEPAQEWVGVEDRHGNAVVSDGCGWEDLMGAIQCSRSDQAHQADRLMFNTLSQCLMYEHTERA